ncbi:MAG: gliding motility-associated C-terminal domain-containing protein [Cyclobacteriaceae bacterium]
MRFLFQSGVYIVVFCFCAIAQLSAQNITEKNWFFGNSQQNLVFDKSGRGVVLEEDQQTPFGTGGSSVINDQFTGDLLFYTDGRNTYDANHNLLPGVSIDPLSANTDFNQAVVTCPVPGNLSQYYIFTNSDTEINYSIVDASLPGNSTSARFPLGEFVGPVNRTMSLTNQSEGMIILESGDGTSYWLISQSRDSHEFHITSIDNSGVFTTRDTTLFSATIPSFEVNQFGHYAYNADSVDLALAPKDFNRNILVLNFNTNSGEISIKSSLRNTGGPDEIYDAAWSSDGSKLYFSVLGDSTDVGGLFQVNFADTVDTDPFLVHDLGVQVYRSYGLRRGIDDRIYHLYQESQGDPFQLGRIEFAENEVALLVYNDIVFDEDFNGTQFPSFAPPQLPMFTSVSFDYRDSCQGNATLFFPEVDPEPNNYFWLFSDGVASNASSPIRSFEPGSYNVTLVAELNGRFGTFNQMIDIIAGDTVDLGNDTTICIGDMLELDPQVASGVEYVWNTGETTPTIFANSDTTQVYWVNVTTTSGCKTYGEITVTVYTSQPDQASSQWYFGERAGLDFTNGAPVAIVDENMMSSPEGCASISDINGDLLFYTNGSTVWNKEHDVMMNGTLIGGDSTAAQSALIIPFSDDDTFFYIFTSEEVYGDDAYSLKYSIVDIKEDTARGAVIKKGVPLVNQSSERVTSTGFDSPIILTHEFGNNNFRAYSISGNGISEATHSSIGEPHLKENELNNSGYMKFSPLASDISVLIPGDSNLVEIFDYNFFNGAIENPRLINLETTSATAQAYGLEYSSDGQKLYVSISDNPVSSILQYDLDSMFSQNPAADIEATRLELTGPTLPDYGALQMGPDGVIYLAIDNNSNLGSISGSASDTPGFTETAIDVDADASGRLSRKGLPNFTQSGGDGAQASASVSVACVGQETSFSGNGLDPNQQVEFFNWNFGDGTFSGLMTGADTTHIYTSPIDTLATLTITNSCNDSIIVLTQPIQAFFIPQEPLVPEDTALCGGTVTLTIWDQDDPDLSFYWSSGDTTRMATFTSVGIVDAAIINNTSGCSSDTVRVFIGDGGNIVDLGEDLQFCQNDPFPTLDSNNQGPDYVWRRDGIIIGDLQTQSVSTSTEGTFVYSVAVTNEFTGCTAIDSVEVVILPAPDITQVNTIQPDCGEANGSLSVLFNDGGSYTYELTQDSITYGPFNFDGPGTSPPISDLLSGTYLLNATNNITGCRSTDVMLLEDDAPFEMEAISDNGCLRSGDIRVVLRNFTGTRVDINVLNSDGESVYLEDNRSASSIFIQDLDTGVYFVSARQVIEPMCLQTDTVRLEAELSCFREIAAPNAFSPNGNDMNEEFFVFPSDFIDTFEIFIYNRWGQIVFNSQDANFRWDGSFQNQPAPPTTYAYKMIFTSTIEPEIGEIVQYGSITLIR